MRGFSVSFLTAQRSPRNVTVRPLFFGRISAFTRSRSKFRRQKTSAPGKRNKDDEKVTDLLYQRNALAQKGQSCRPVFNEIAFSYSKIISYFPKSQLLITRRNIIIPVEQHVPLIFDLNILKQIILIISIFQ